MYKKQMTMQRIICLLSLVVGAIVFLYSLGLMTDLYDMLYSMVPYPDDPSSVKVEGAMIYFDMQQFNHQLLWAGIILILLGCLLFVTNTHSRRKYYIGNYTASCLNAAALVGVSVWTHLQVEMYKAQYLGTVDFAALERRLSRQGTYTDSTFWFDIHYLVIILAIVIAVLLVLNMIWKNRLMTEEQKLLAEGGKVVKQ